MADEFINLLGIYQGDLINKNLTITDTEKLNLSEINSIQVSDFLLWLYFRTLQTLIILITVQLIDNRKTN